MASSNMDNQASFGSKRTRNNVLRKDGDWICTTCGNLNFAFRIACHKILCNAPKPSGNPAPKPLGSPISKPALAGEIMSGPPAPAAAVYGIPINFGSIPSSIPYGSHGAMAPRIFGPRTSLQPGTSIPSGSFGAIPSLPSGSFGGILVNQRADINPHGYGFQAPSPWDAGLSKKDSQPHKPRVQGKDGIPEGDWLCPKCENVNFAFRTKCNMKQCRFPRPTPVPLPVFPQGSWSCRKCGNMNYPYRNTCNMKGCGVERTASDN